MDPSETSPHRFRSLLPRKPWQIALVALFGLLAVGVVVLTVIAAAFTPTLPAIQELTDTRLKVPLRVYTADGLLIAEFGDEKRIPISIDEVPDTLVQAILAAEDHSFFQHQGVDFVGIVRAAWHNFRTQSPSQGGSTITMQVARNFFLTPEKTYSRKIREVLLAFKIERELSKKKILELYVNKIFLGHRAYGFAAAAQIYFGSPLEKLAIPEMALLAALPKAPSRDNPLTNPQGALERRNYVLRRMFKLGFIDEAVLTQSVNTPLTVGKHALKYDLEAPYIAEMVRQYMLATYDEKTYAGGFHVYTTIQSKHQRAANQALRSGLLEYDRRHGYRGPAGHVPLRERGDTTRLDDALKDYRSVGDLLPGIVTEVAEQSASIYTQDGFTAVLDWAGMAWARRYIDENAVAPAPATAGEILKIGDIVYLEPVAETQAGQGRTWRLAQVPKVSGALVSLRPSDGAISALVGGFDFYQSNFNRVTQAERQPGSSLKPFVYTAALEKGFTAATTISGAPIVIDDAVLEDEWRPENYTKKFFGPTRLRKALALSLNLVSIRLLRATGPAYAAEYLGRFGFDPAKLPRDLSLALGTASATPMQMVSAFSIFANGGYRIKPYFITRVEDARHNVLEQADPAVAGIDTRAAPMSGTHPAMAQPEIATLVPVAQAATTKTRRAAPRVINPEIGFIMTSMMQDVIRDGTGKGAAVLGRGDLAGKTGTTDDYRDAWFTGFNADVVTTAWIGFDQPASLGRGEAGGRTAVPMWVDYMRVVLEGVPDSPAVVPPGVVKALINSETGTPTHAGDPLAIEEYFVKGSQATAGAPLGTEETTLSEEPTVPDNVREQLF